MTCLPDSMAGKVYYDPAGLGEEAALKARLEQIKAWKKEQEKKRG